MSIINSTSSLESSSELRNSTSSLGSYGGLVLSSVSECALGAEDEVCDLVNDVFEELINSTSSDASALNPDKVSSKIGIEGAKTALVTCSSENVLNLAQQFDESSINDLSVIKLALEKCTPEHVLNIMNLFNKDLLSTFDVMEIFFTKCDREYLTKNIPEFPHLREVIEQWSRSIASDVRVTRLILEKVIPVEEVVSVFREFDESVKSDLGVIKLALEKCEPRNVPDLFKYMSESSRSNIEVIKLALEKCEPRNVPNLFQHIGESGRSNIEAIKLFLEKCEPKNVLNLIQLFNKDLLSDFDFMGIVLKKICEDKSFDPDTFLGIIQSSGETLLKNPKFITICLEFIRDDGDGVTEFLLREIAHENLRDNAQLMQLALEKANPELILRIVKLFSEDLKNNIDLMSLALSRYKPYQNDLELMYDLVKLFGEDAKNDTTLMMLALDKIYHKTYCGWLIDIVSLCGPGIQDDPMQMCLILEKYVELIGQTKKHSEKYEILNQLSEPLKQEIIQFFQWTYGNKNLGDDQVIPTIIQMLNDGGENITLRQFLPLTQLRFAD